jgi:N-acetylmuramic acid 6-phosphate etherase
MPDDLLTEAVLESTRDLDRRSAREILELIHAQDLVAARAVGLVLGEIERAVEVLVLVLQGGGRWFNVGAGTSGRMGVLDAAEIPPTFGYPADRVQAIQAGGLDAVWRAQEGVEDRAEDARLELRRRELLPGDAVLAISASGRTPFTLAALEEAACVGARRLALTCDPSSPLVALAEVAIAPEVGPEVIAGSTRMKGGLAQKMVLHLLSTTVMVRLGRVEGNQMTNLVPASRKLEGRALRILSTLGEIDEPRARTLLRECHGSVQEALARLRAERGEPSQK